MSSIPETCAGVLLVLAAVLQTASPRCLHPLPGLESPNLQDKVSHSDLVVTGVVERRFQHSVSDGFVAQVRVRCVYKGGPSPSVLNVSYAGHTSGPCVKTKLSPASKHLVYLKRQANGEFLPTFTDDPATRNYMDELSTVCGLSVQYPQGVRRETAEEKCEADRSSVDYDDSCRQTLTTAASGFNRAPHMRTEWAWLVVVGVMCMWTMVLR